jgi:hypothetical protein
LIMRPVHSVRKVPGCFGDRNRCFFNKMRLSEFAAISIRAANSQASCLKLGSGQSPADHPPPRTEPRNRLNSEASEPETARAGCRQTQEKDIPGARRTTTEVLQSSETQWSSQVSPAPETWPHVRGISLQGWQIRTQRGTIVALGRAAPGQPPPLSFLGAARTSRDGAYL